MLCSEHLLEYHLHSCLKLSVNLDRHERDLRMLCTYIDEADVYRGAAAEADAMKWTQLINCFKLDYVLIHIEPECHYILITYSTPNRAFSKVLFPTLR